MTDNRERIVEVALTVLGRDPDAGMSEIAAAAEVVRRTVYGHFPTRADLVRTLAERAAAEVTAVLTAADDGRRPADAAWTDFIARLWPVVHRYRVLVALRRGDHGEEIHDLLQPVERLLTDLVRRGQHDRVFGTHLNAATLSQVAWGAVFTIAADQITGGDTGVRAATITSLLILGVPEERATALAADRA